MGMGLMQSSFLAVKNLSFIVLVFLVTSLSLSEHTCIFYCCLVSFILYPSPITVILRVLVEPLAILQGTIALEVIAAITHKGILFLGAIKTYNNQVRRVDFYPLMGKFKSDILEVTILVFTRSKNMGTQCPKEEEFCSFFM